MAIEKKTTAVVGGGAAAETVKLAMPFDLQCGNNKCGRRMDKGQKCWGLKKVIGMDSFFDVKIYRFEFKCRNCRSDFSIKTDPGRYDYVVESGAAQVSRNFSNPSS